jgi:hypothetical protein
VRHRAVRAGLLVQLALAATGVWAASASAQPVSGPHETVDSRMTTTRPNTPTGFTYKGTYHAAGDRNGTPPYMRRMKSYSPPGLRYDTSVPARCTASDIELELRGAAACPAASRVGGGTTVGNFMGRFPSTLTIDAFNNTNEQVFVVSSPFVASVARGKINPDGTVEFASPTCYPALGQPPACPVDNALQVSSSVTVKPYVRSSHGRVRSYFTTPRKCPAAGYWKTPIRFWWADGSVDTVVTKQACTRPRHS